MPITPAYTWRETEERLTVEVTLRSISRNQTDIVCTECFLKVNSAPYLLQVDLFDEVQAKTSTAVVSETGVTFNLYKVTRGLWGRLTTDLEKQEALERRRKSLEAFREAAGKQKEDARLLKERTNKLALEKQWALEDAKKQTLEKRKVEELQKAQADLLDWQKKTTAPATSENGSSNGEKNRGLEEDAESSDNEEMFIPANRGRAAIVEIDDSDEEIVKKSAIHSRSAVPARDSDAPLVVERASGQGLSGLLDLDTEATNEKAPLVARSSRRFDSQKNASNGSHSKAASDSKNSTASELEEKENAEQIKSSGGSEIVKGGQPKPAAETVLPPPRRKLVVPVQFTAKELRPNVPARESRLKEIELKKAQSAAQDDDSVDISDRQPAFLKDKGDALYKAGDYQGAISAYTRAVEKDPMMALCYSNRSACYLRLGQLDSCVSDCTRAVDLLQQQLEEGIDGQDEPREISNGQKSAASVGVLDSSPAKDNTIDTSAASELLEAPKRELESSKESSCEDLTQSSGSESNLVSKERSKAEDGIKAGPSTATIEWSRNKGPNERERIHTALVKVLVRRAAAQCEIGQTAEAIADYKDALKMDPRNKSIRNDLQKLEDFLTPPKKSEWKARGDSLYKEGDIEGAVEAYTNGVDCEEQDASITRACISNRSVCYIRLEMFHEAEGDCSRGLALVGFDQSVCRASTTGNAESVDVQACLKLLSRRGMVHGHLKQYDAAIRDLEAAIKLAKSADRFDLLQDLDKDMNLLKQLNEA